MIRVKSTREGLPGGHTASGYVIDAVVPFVALPAAAALHSWVRVRNPLTHKECRALVLDVGPWNEHDHAYVFQPLTLEPDTATSPDAAPEVRPAAESGLDTRGRATNGAGIDLGEQVWHALGMTDNSEVEWEFV